MSVDPTPRQREPAPLLSVSLERHATATLVRLSGELDMASGPELDAAVTRVLQPGQGCVVIDLTAVTFCDASGLSALLRARRRVTDAQRRLTLSGARPPLRRLASLTGLEDLFDD